MPRLPRSLLPDGVFHVTARGVDGVSIVRDDFDGLAFVRLLREAISTREWLVHAWCLMTNHYQLIVETERPSLSDGLKRLNGVYAQRFNARHGRTGHLFGRRFSAYVIDEDDFEAACRYVLDNPVRAGLCADAADWTWSGGLVDERVAARG
jgi:REP element-mobilizing transposase RayT